MEIAQMISYMQSGHDNGPAWIMSRVSQGTGAVSALPSFSAVQQHHTKNELNPDHCVNTVSESCPFHSLCQQ
jgi:hypothetical protein